MDDDDIAELKLLENRLSVPEGFIVGLLDESDWGFVIKLHALLEATITELLTVALRTPELARCISHLPLSDTRIGKVEFTAPFEILEKDHRRFIRSLSELRNALVHDVTNVNFDLRAHVALLDNAQFSRFAQSFHVEAYFQPDLSDDSAQAEIFQNPKVYIWQGGCGLLNWLSNNIRWQEYDREHERMSLEVFGAIIQRNLPENDENENT
jgi:hypothetical protein